MELLVAMGLFAVILSIAFAAFSGSNRLVETDTGRVMATQNVQTALDLLSADVRQAGESLALNYASGAIEFDNTTDTLIVRRGLPDVTTLPLCNVSGTSIQVVGPLPGATTPTAATPPCTYSINTSAVQGDDPTAITNWRAAFASQGGQPQAALLMRPASGTTPVLISPAVVNSVAPKSWSPPVYRVSVNLAATLPSGFNTTNGSQLILVDQRRYQVVGDELRLTVGAQTTSQVVAYGVTDMSLSATLTGPETTVTSLALPTPWARVKSISLTLTAGSSGQGINKPLSFSATVYPRNVEQARSGGTSTP